MPDPADFLPAQLLIRAGGGIDEFSRKRRTRKAPPLQTPLLAVPGWFPHRGPASPEESRGHFDMLVASVEQRGWPWRRTAVVASDGAWAEAALAVSGVAETEVLTVASAAGQRLIFRVDTAAVEVLGPSGVVLRTIAVGTRDLKAAPCPMQTGLTKPCRNPGGPWTGRSRAAAGRYEHDRAHLVAAMGCGICRDGAVSVSDGSSILERSLTADGSHAPTPRNSPAAQNVSVSPTCDANDYRQESSHE